MKSPITGTDMKRIKRQEVAEFRGEQIPYFRHAYVDEQGEEFSTTALDELNLRQVWNVYRSRYKIPFPSEIKAIRGQYKLSAAKMSEVLDLGVNSYRQYESEEPYFNPKKNEWKPHIPSLANAKLIRIAKDPLQFKKFVQEKEKSFSPKAYQKLMSRIDDLLKPPDSIEPVVGLYLESRHGGKYFYRLCASGLQEGGSLCDLFCRPGQAPQNQA